VTNSVKIAASNSAGGICHNFYVSLSVRIKNVLQMFALLSIC